MSAVLHFVESMLLGLIPLYDKYMYTPIQLLSAPFVRRTPRWVTLFGTKYAWFTANTVTYSRMFLIIPVAFCIRFGMNWAVFWLVILHDYLDHLDGIVAKEQKKMYGQLDDPLLGSFNDAFGDKVVNVSTLYSLLLLHNWTADVPTWQTVVHWVVCWSVIVGELVLGVVRVQDYYTSKYGKGLAATGVSINLAASMEGKLKEKLESVGMALLCLSHHDPVGFFNQRLAAWVMLAISVRFSYASYQHKMEQRRVARASASPASQADTGKVEEEAAGQEVAAEDNDDNASVASAHRKIE